MRRAFTLIELLVVIAVVALLVGLLLPALRGAREAGRGAACLSNLRQCFVACRTYADENKGFSPAIGQPYAALPNWALVVQGAMGAGGTTAGEQYLTRGVLVCPTTRSRLGPEMQRTYAMNATGHAGLAGDADNYDAGPAFVRMDRVARAGETPMLVDSAAAAPAPGSPPPTRTASMIDFRQPSHVGERLARVHARDAFNAGMFDGSARARIDVAEWWGEPLP